MRMFKHKDFLILGIAMSGVAAVPAVAATQDTGGESLQSDGDMNQVGQLREISASESESESCGIIVTGSHIRQDPENSDLPMTIVTNRDLKCQGVSNPEQLVCTLSAELKL